MTEIDVEYNKVDFHVCFASLGACSSASSDLCSLSETRPDQHLSLCLFKLYLFILFVHFIYSSLWSDLSRASSSLILLSFSELSLANLDASRIALPTYAFNISTCHIHIPQLLTPRCFVPPRIANEANNCSSDHSAPLFNTFCNCLTKSSLITFL
jgi:hypothetical protein